jgi:hypothetical protein
VLHVSTHDGKFVDRIDSPNGTAGDEPYAFIATEPAMLRITVAKWSRTAPNGKYFVKPVSVRPATPDEIRHAKLKSELLKIVEEENRVDLNLDVLTKYFDRKALLTSPVGNTETGGAVIEIAKQYSGPRPDLGATNKIEISDVKLQEFGDVAVMSVHRYRHFIAPALDMDRKGMQRIGYVFKRTNGEWRVISSQRTWIERDREPVAIAAKQLDAYVGVYEGSKPSRSMTVTREGTQLYAKFSIDSERWELIPENETTFYGVCHAMFLKDKDGAVTQALVYFPLPEDRLDLLRKIQGS